MALKNSKAMDGFNLKTANKEFIDIKSQSFVSDNRYSPLRVWKITEQFNCKFKKWYTSWRYFSFKQTSQETGKKSIVIVGDSIIKQVAQWKMSSNKTAKVRSFPGATIEDMADYSRPLLRNNPSSLIISMSVRTTWRMTMRTLWGINC